MESPKTILPMQTLVLCSDVQFLGTTRSVLTQFQVTPRIAANCDEAAALIDSQEFDVIILDWREISNLADFLSALRRSKLNRECVLVAIVRDLLNLRQAFAAGVLFLIHKPPSTLQIERCLRAAYCATVARRRKQHREPVQIVATLGTRHHSDVEALMVNLSEGGAGLQTRSSSNFVGSSFEAGEDISLRFTVPGSELSVEATGIVVWTTADTCGVRFRHIAEEQKEAFQSWLTECVERSLATLRDRVEGVCA